MPSKTDTQPTTPEQIRGFAKSIQKVAARVATLADDLSTEGIETIDVGMLPTLRDGIDDLSKWIGHLEHAYNHGLLLVHTPKLPSKRAREPEKKPSRADKILKKAEDKASK